MEANDEKIGFFKRIKIAIFKLEDYGMFLGERCSKAFKFFFLLIILTSIVISLVSGYDFYKMINKAFNYIKNEMPEFTYQDEKMISSENVEAYDSDYNFRLFINTDENVHDETLKDYENKVSDADGGLIVLRDKVIYLYENNRIEENYSELLKNYEIEVTNKEELVKTINDLGMGSIVLAYFSTNFIVLTISDLITNLSYLCIVAIFGYIAARFCGVRFKLSPMFALSIYSLTLPITLSCIYNIVYILTGFVIKYFNVMYLLIAYVYIIAAILMIKYDLIKQNEELQKIIEVQKQVRKEMDEQEEKTEEKEEKEEDSNDEESPVIEENNEPDGSEI